MTHTRRNVDADRQPILERSEVYSGVYGRASINLYAFNSNDNKGIACGLNNLQKIRDGKSDNFEILLFGRSSITITTNVPINISVEGGNAGIR